LIGTWISTKWAYPRVPERGDLLSEFMDDILTQSEPG
jgi:hypothetical protein